MNKVYELASTLIGVLLVPSLYAIFQRLSNRQADHQVFLALALIAERT